MDAEPVRESTTGVKSQVQDCFALLPGEAEENGELLFWPPQRSAETDAPYEVHEIFNNEVPSASKKEVGLQRASNQMVQLWFRDLNDESEFPNTMISLDLNNLNLSFIRGNAELMKPFQGFLYSHPEYCSLLRTKLAAVESAHRSARLFAQLDQA